MDLKIDFSMDEDHADRIKTKIGELNAELAFLVDLTSDQIKSLEKSVIKVFLLLVRLWNLPCRTPVFCREVLFYRLIDC